jgi:hypothetical protein
LFDFQFFGTSLSNPTDPCRYVFEPPELIRQNSLGARHKKIAWMPQHARASTQWQVNS